jgi:uncharacterized protein
LSSLSEQQRAFAAHLRDPELNPAPADIEDRRMEIYRELFFNNVRSFLAGYFPIVKSIVGEAAWDQLVRGFYRDHASQTPLFTELASEFLDYLANEHEPAPAEPEFIVELAHYEWVEGALQLAPDPEPDARLNDGDLLAQAPQLSSVAWLLSYNWPVHEISAAQQPTEPLAEPAHFLIYRSTENKIVFNRLNPVSARLLQLIGEPHNRVTGQAALEQIASELQHAQPEQVIAAGKKMLNDWRAKSIILGTYV